MPATLSTTKTTGLTTAHYTVANFGFLAERITEIAPAYLHTFSNTQIPASTYFPDLQNLQLGDFNADGLTDVALTFNYYTHLLPRPALQARTQLLFGDGKGNLAQNPTLFTAAASHAGHYYESSAVADFNGDGRDDVVNASGGLNNILTGVYTGEPIPLLMSGPGGVFFDATSYIAGQENGTSLVPGFLFTHSITAGDFDGDGDKDLFTGKLLLLNDRTGHFSNATSQLPAVLTGNTKLMLPSIAGDFDGDGIDDIATFGGTPGAPTATAGGYVMLSGKSSAFAQRVVKELPYGYFGAAATTTRDAAVGDIDGDGDIDLVALSSRDSPNFLQGIALQLLVNDGKGNFTDTSSSNIDNSVLGAIKTANGSDASSYGGSNVNLLDWNGDGHLDLLISSGMGPSHGNASMFNIFENDGTGKFTLLNLDMLPHVRPSNLAGFENNQNNPYFRQTFGADLNGDRMLDFISAIDTPTSNRTDPAELTLYTILSTSVYGTGPAGVDGASVGAPGFNEKFYLGANPAAAAAVKSGQYANGLAHFLAVGKAAGLQSFAKGTHVYGSSGNDTIALREGNEQAFGEAGNDRIIVGAGNDTVDGGAGLDTVVFTGNRAAYSVSQQSGMLKVNGTDGSDSLKAVERIVFSDKGIAFDLDGNAGLTARTLGAVFGKAALNDPQYLKIGLGLFDGGMSHEAVMKLALQAKLGAAASNAAVVNLLYTNVIGTAPDAASAAGFVKLLDSGTLSQAALGVVAANHGLNATSIGLVGLSQSGLEFAL